MEINIYKGHKVPEAKGVCIIIDVLRAFTTAAFAFASGAKEIIFVATPEEALLKHQSDSSLLLMGEKEGKRIDGFHFENSPTEVKNANLTGRRMVQRTSSGTQGVVGCRHAAHILVSSFVVADATIKRVLELKPTHVSCIATGRTNGDEDVALAEYLQSKLLGKPADLNALLKRVSSSLCANRILSYKYGQTDIELAMKVDHFPFAMEVFKEGSELVGKAIKVRS